MSSASFSKNTCKKSFAADRVHCASAPVVEEKFVYGVYDIIARVEADTMEKVKERLDRVRSTLTMIVVEG